MRYQAALEAAQKASELAYKKSVADFNANEAAKKAAADKAVREAQKKAADDSAAQRKKDAAEKAKIHETLAAEQRAIATK